jgi:hypothetical protein
MQAYQTSQYVVPRGGMILGKWRSCFQGNSESKLNIQSACAMNTRYYRHITYQCPVYLSCLFKVRFIVMDLLIWIFPTFLLWYKYSMIRIWKCFPVPVRPTGPVSFCFNLDVQSYRNGAAWDYECSRALLLTVISMTSTFDIFVINGSLVGLFLLLPLGE